MMSERITPRVETSQKSSWWLVAVFMMSCQAIVYVTGSLSGAFKRQSWIDDTPKPKIWSPAWIFPLVWIGNYTLMGRAALTVWDQRQAKQVSSSLALFAVHLLHNLLFLPIVYQVKKRSFYVLMDSVGLVLAATISGLFFRISRRAGLLMLPYLGWMCYTTLIKILWWRMETKT